MILIFNSLIHELGFNNFMHELNFYQIICLVFEFDKADLSSQNLQTGLSHSDNISVFLINLTKCISSLHINA